MVCMIKRLRDQNKNMLSVHVVSKAKPITVRLGYLEPDWNSLSPASAWEVLAPIQQPIVKTSMLCQNQGPAPGFSSNAEFSQEFGRAAESGFTLRRKHTQDMPQAMLKAQKCLKDHVTLRM